MTLSFTRFDKCNEIEDIYAQKIFTSTSSTNLQLERTVGHFRSHVETPSRLFTREEVKEGLMMCLD